MIRGVVIYKDLVPWFHKPYKRIENIQPRNEDDPLLRRARIGSSSYTRVVACSVDYLTSPRSILFFCFPPIILLPSDDFLWLGKLVILSFSFCIFEPTRLLISAAGDDGLLSDVTVEWQLVPPDAGGGSLIVFGDLYLELNRELSEALIPVLLIPVLEDLICRFWIQYNLLLAKWAVL